MMSMDIKLEVSDDGKVYAFVFDHKLKKYAPSSIWGTSPRLALLALAADIKRKQEGEKEGSR